LYAGDAQGLFHQVIMCQGLGRQASLAATNHTHSPPSPHSSLPPPAACAQRLSLLSLTPCRQGTERSALAFPRKCEQANIARPGQMRSLCMRPGACENGRACCCVDHVGMVASNNNSGLGSGFAVAETNQPIGTLPRIVGREAAGGHPSVHPKFCQGPQILSP